ncbi:type II toxin-antitoxin system Phd/YefM family antitoxin [Jiella pelagia]|uniref:Antitoxin n=1 Tax=Jiella pelagia TaxID=2986949 RepID=A0ABY7C002_9HYPH|nr:type II toxin-antitoxin system Phd/YefM family antitoxin [Jiella pelagia]WAP68987.1 type II toxin-antitoxin system Phd/YefM family antitoxin [Jiella pelagia]
MPHVSFSELRANMASHFDRIEADRTELIVTRQNHEPVVVLALSEWEAIQETMHLLRLTGQCRTSSPIDRAGRCRRGGRA